MREWLGKITVVPKPAVNDPQGIAVLDGLHSLDFEEVRQVRVGKHLDVRLQAESQEQANEQLNVMCERLLANTLIESYEVRVEESDE